MIAGDLEELIDEPFQPVGLFQRNVGEPGALRFRQSLSLVQQAEIADHAGQRRFDVVSQIDDQIVLALFCGLSLLGALVQLGLHLGEL